MTARVRVRFADPRAEDDFQRLGASNHPEDRRLFASLRTLLEQVEANHMRAVRLDPHEVPRAHQGLEKDGDLFQLETPDFGQVLLMRKDDEIMILDHD